MPRDSSGNYTLPAGNPVVTGTTISSTWANTTLTDVGTVLTASLDRSGNGGMLAPFKLVDGALGAPGLSFANEPTTGLYRIGANHVGFAVGGTEKLDLTGTAFTIGVLATLNGNLTVAGNTYLTGLAGVSATLQITGSSTSGVSSVAGTEIYNTGSIGVIQAYNRNSSAYMPMEMLGSTLTIQIGGSSYALTCGTNGAWAFASSLTGTSTLTVNALATSTVLVLQGGDSNYCLRLINAAATSGGSLIIPSGSNSGLIIGSDAGPLYLHDSTGIYSTGATGGAKGAGTINVAGFYINGVVVYAGIPQNNQSGATYTLVLADAGKAVYSSYSGSATFTIPQNVFSVSAVVTFVNDGSGTLSITPATGVTLTLAGTTTTGTRSIAANGIATAYMVTANNWLISGSGLS